MRKGLKAARFVIAASVLLALAGCSAQNEETPAVVADTEASAVEEVETSEVVEDEEWDYDQILIDGARKGWPGYPLIVSGSSIDERVSRNLGNPERVVAIGPAMYLPYMASQPDLDFYLLHPTGVTGNCIMIYTLEEMMSFVGKRLLSYSCWDDVYVGDEEPVLE